MKAIGNNKKCCRCQEWKCVEAFHKEARRADGLRSACKDCSAAYNSTYDAANKEKIAAKAAAHREANKEKIAARSAAYNAANKEKIAARSAAYRAKQKFALEKLRELGMQI